MGLRIDKLHVFHETFRLSVVTESNIGNSTLKQ